MPSTIDRLRGFSTFWNAANWTGGVLPAAGDTAQVMDGFDDLTSTNDASGTNLAAVIFGANYGTPTTTVGTNPEPIKVVCDQSGAGLFRFQGQAASINLVSISATSKIDIVEISPGNSTCVVSLSAMAITTELLVDSGTVTLGSTCDVNTLLTQTGGTVIVSERAADPIPTINVRGGRMTLRRRWTSLNVSGGAVVTIDLPAGETGGTIVNNGGTVVHKRGNTGAHTHAGGTIDFSTLASSPTIASATVYAGTVYIKERGTFAPVYTSGLAIRGKGPRYAST